MFRAFAETTGSDLPALAACMRGSRRVITAKEIGEIAAPTLVCVGSRDEVAGDPEPLASMMRNARAFVIPGRDHNRAVGDKLYKEVVLAFLESLQ
jgi:pimeloyl-ACP methyl ester carboxylesterase